MKKLWIFSVLFLAAGVVMLLLPVPYAADRCGSSAAGPCHGDLSTAVAETNQGEADGNRDYGSCSLGRSCDFNGSNGNYYIQRCCGLEKR